MTFGAPFKGRTIPFGIHTYSPSTIEEECSSRNTEHSHGLAEIVEIIGDLPVIFDREFSYGGLLKDFEAEKARFVIRFNQGKRRCLLATKPPPSGAIAPVDVASCHALSRAKPCEVPASRKGFKKPLFIITNIEDPSKAIDLYLERMKIEQSFKDLKDKLGIHKCMSKNTAT